MAKNLLLLLLLPVQLIFGQTSLTLQSCYSEAIKNHPLSKQKDLQQLAYELQIQNVKTAYLPKLDLNAQTTYQSQVVEFNLPIPNFVAPTISKDQYKATVDVNQMIYDGGLTQARKNMETASLAADTQQVAVDVNQIKAQINQVFFQILILQENEKQIELLKSQLLENRKALVSRVNNGVLKKSALDVLDVEILNIDQKLSDLDINKTTGFKILSLLLNKQISETTVLEIPLLDASLSSKSTRPEYALFNLQLKKLDASSKLTGVNRMPRLYGFGQAGYGRPAFNFLDNTFQPFYIVGAKFTWNIWDWHQTKNQTAQMELQKNMINAKQQAFDQALNIQETQALGLVSQYEASLKQDEQIVALRTDISKSSLSQFENGVITASEYVSQVNAEAQAKINITLHKLQLQQAKINYLTLKGEL